MFFNLTWRNAKRSRSENLIYFLTMITAVAMFYIVLSLGQQDVIRFLSEIESDAVERLLTNLLPTVYLCALLFVFFLVVFANKYQLECRSRELGLYLMFGMTKIMNAHRDTKQRQLREVTFSDLSPLEEKQLYVCDEYFADDEAEQSFVVGGKEITAKLLAEALHSLPEEKRETVLLYYFFDMSEREIAKFCNLSRTTVQSRRTSSMKLLKRYLEEKAYDCTD